MLFQNSTWILILSTTSNHLVASSLVAHSQTLASLVAKSLSTLTAVGVPTVVVLSLVKITPRSTAQQHMPLAGSPSPLSQQLWLGVALSRFHTLLVSRSHSLFMSRLTDLDVCQVNILEHPIGRVNRHFVLVDLKHRVN